LILLDFRFRGNDDNEYFPTFYELINVDAVKRGEGWAVRAEVVGPRVLRPSEVKLIEERVSKATHKKVGLHLWCRVELMVNRNHFISIDEDFTKDQVEKRLTRNKSTKTK